MFELFFQSHNQGLHQVDSILGHPRLPCPATPSFLYWRVHVMDSMKGVDCVSPPKRTISSPISCHSVVLQANQYFPPKKDKRKKCVLVPRPGFLLVTLFRISSTISVCSPLAKAAKCKGVLPSLSAGFLSSTLSKISLTAWSRRFLSSRSSGFFMYSVTQCSGV